MLENKSLRGKKVATIYGDIKFDDEGKSVDLTKVQKKTLGKLPGFQYIEVEKVTAKKAPAKKAPAKKKSDNK